MESTTVFGDSAILAGLGDDTLCPDMEIGKEWMDADDELRDIANFIKKSSSYNMEVDVDRIKFLYTINGKKEGGRYTAGWLVVRSEMEKAIDDRYDFIICVYHPIWSLLDTVNKTIQLDKVMCGVKVDYKQDGSKKYGKTMQNSREYLNNLQFFGAEKVIQSSELVHQTGLQVEDAAKQQKKAAKQTKEGGVDFSQFLNAE